MCQEQYNMHCLEIGQMNSTKFVFLLFPYHNTGGHFIIWSLYFLSGQAQHLVGDNQIIDCVVDPDITAKNFHQQKVLMSCGFEDTKEKKYTEAQLIWAIQEAYGDGRDEANDALSHQVEDSVKTILNYLKPKSEWVVDFVNGKLKIIY